MSLSRLILFAALFAVGCSKKPAESADSKGGVTGSRIEMKRMLKGEAGVGNVGKKISDGIAIDLRATSDGKNVTYLLDAQKPRLDGIPPMMRVGELFVVPTEGGDARKLASGVTNMPGGYLTSPDGRWLLVLAGYNAAEQSGELRAIDLRAAGSEPERLGGTVTYMLASPDSSQVAFVDEGKLKVGALPKGPFKEVASDVATAEFSPDGKTLYFRRRVNAAGGLYQVPIADAGKPPRKVADQVGDFRLTPDGRLLAYAARPSLRSPTYDLFICDTTALKSREVQRGAIDFRFSPDGQHLAFNVGTSPEDPGDLMVAAIAGGEAKKLGEQVHDFKFSPDSSRLVWRERYGENEGDLATAELVNGTVKKLFKRARSYAWSDDSRSIAFTYRVLKPIISVDLGVWRVGDEAATTIKQWVYDYDFTNDSKSLLFRSDCIRDGRSCDLLRLEMAELKQPPKKIVEAMFGFRLSKNGERVLITYSRMQTGDFYDVASYNLKTNERKTLEQFIRLPALQLNDDGTKVAYIVGEQNKAGVYVADAP